MNGSTITKAEREALNAEYARERTLREKWWREESSFCRCGAHTRPVRRYFRVWMCVCSGWIH